MLVKWFAIAKAFFSQHPIPVTILAGLLLVLLIWSLTGASPEPVSTSIGKSSISDSTEAIPVVAVPVQIGNLDIYLYGLGAVTPLNAVNISSRVDGQLMTIDFAEGEMVKAGDLLAQIDPHPYQVQLELATGQLARDQALLDKASIDLKRYRTLLAQDSTSLQLVESKASLVREYEAAILADRGGVTNARMKLDYAQITAPISGRTGFRQVNPGNFLRAAEAINIVTITQLDPISVIFPVPEDALPAVMKLLNSDEPIPVVVFDRALKNQIGTGKLLAADNQIDATTGTVKLKAELPNPDHSLFVNQFVNVRMSTQTLHDAMLVPNAAIQRGAPGTFVYRVNEQEGANNEVATVSVVPVEVGSVQDTVTVIKSGLTPGVRVVIEGADRLRDGATIKVVNQQNTASDPLE